MQNAKLHKESTAGQRPLICWPAAPAELVRSLASVAVFGESDHCALFPMCLSFSLKKEGRRGGIPIPGLAPKPCDGTRAG